MNRDLALNQLLRVEVNPFNELKLGKTSFYGIPLIPYTHCLVGIRNGRFLVLLESELSQAIFEGIIN